MGADNGYYLNTESAEDFGSRIVNRKEDLLPSEERPRSLGAWDYARILFSAPQTSQFLAASIRCLLPAIYHGSFPSASRT